MYDQTGAEFLSHFIGSDYASLLANLQDRRVVVFGRGSSCRSPVIVDVNDSRQLADWRRSIVDEVLPDGLVASA